MTQLKYSAGSNKLTNDFNFRFVEENKVANTNSLVLNNILRKAKFYLDLEDNSPSSLVPICNLHKKLQLFDNIDDHLSQIISQIKLSNKYLDKAFTNIDSAEKQFMLDNSFKFIDATLTSEKELAEVDEFKKLIALTKKLDYKYFFYAALEIAKIYDKEYLFSLKKVIDELEDKKIDLPDFHHYQGALKYFENNKDIGNIVIGGSLDNKYFTNVTVLIEPAGDDFYGNNWYWNLRNRSFN